MGVPQNCVSVFGFCCGLDGRGFEVNGAPKCEVVEVGGSVGDWKKEATCGVYVVCAYVALRRDVPRSGLALRGVPAAFETVSSGPLVQRARGASLRRAQSKAGALAGALLSGGSTAY